MAGVSRAASLPSCPNSSLVGGVAEWLNAAVSKTVSGVKPLTRVRIPPPPLTSSDRIRGCLLGGAVGDALGAGIEFAWIEDIIRRFGPGGSTDYVEAYGRRGAITDDTQMTLFTAEGLLRARVRVAREGIADVRAIREPTPHP